MRGRNLGIGLMADLALYFPMWDPGPGSIYDVAGQQMVMARDAGAHQVQGKVCYAIDDPRYWIADPAVATMGPNQSFSISLWMNLASKANSQAFVSKGANPVFDYIMYYLTGTDRFAFETRDAGGVGVVYADNLGSPTLGVWYLVTGLLEYGVGQTIMVNDPLPNSAPNPVDFAQDYHGTFCIGQNDRVDYFMDGQICEVAVFRRPVAWAEHLWLYNRGRGRAFPWTGEYSPVGLGRGHGLTVSARRNRLAGQVI